VQGLATRYSTPWDQDANDEASTEETANVLRAWRRSGTITRDARRVFYAYQQTGPRGSQQGLLAAVHLDSRLLPYEEVIPTRAESIAELLHSGQTELGPVLLGYRGTGRAAHHVAALRQQEPLVEVLADDGQLHRMWPITAAEDQADIAAELAALPAFIADGHHRYIAARQLRRDYITAGGQTGAAWNYLHALLIDTKDSPLRLAPIHRVLPGIDPQQAMRAAASRFRVLPLTGELEDWVRMLKEHAPHGPAFVVVTPDRPFLLVHPDPGFIAATLRHKPPALRAMSVTVLHSLLIETLWKSLDSPARINYESSASRAVREVQDYGGLAVLLAPPNRTDVEAAAASGVRMPSKSTSFGPKPHPGLVMRTLDDL
jgi:uncharacterized protein (DUF1015 family)